MYSNIDVVIIDTERVFIMERMEGRKTSDPVQIRFTPGSDLDLAAPWLLFQLTPVSSHWIITFQITDLFLFAINSGLGNTFMSLLWNNCQKLRQDHHNVNVGGVKQTESWASHQTLSLIKHEPFMAWSMQWAGGGSRIILYVILLCLVVDTTGSTWQGTEGLPVHLDYCPPMTVVWWAPWTLLRRWFRQVLPTSDLRPFQLLSS